MSYTDNIHVEMFLIHILSLQEYVRTSSFSVQIMWFTIRVRVNHIEQQSNTYKQPVGSQCFLLWELIYCSVWFHLIHSCIHHIVLFPYSTHCEIMQVKIIVQGDNEILTRMLCQSMWSSLLLSVMVGLDKIIIH